MEECVLEVEQSALSTRVWSKDPRRRSLTRWDLFAFDGLGCLTWTTCVDRRLIRRPCGEQGRPAVGVSHRCRRRLDPSHGRPTGLQEAEAGGDFGRQFPWLLDRDFGLAEFGSEEDVCCLACARISYLIGIWEEWRDGATDVSTAIKTPEREILVKEVEGILLLSGSKICS
ncbi:hypothetical protein MA16_Dca016704 [Dendrobium catenatum]|uniref:Uncharacterized protein n=1 Tax=Dendrobium catenatum TaxID=906689 RepID=A0A2I0VJL9_9ASPA|nr:hypothetical protein MA16_Dca016704 [Dendrobium catenatum]